VGIKFCFIFTSDETVKLDLAIQISSKEMLQHEKRLADDINNVMKCWLTALATTTTTIFSNTSSSSDQRDGTEQSLLKPVAKAEDVITTQNNRTRSSLIPNKIINEILIQPLLPSFVS
jgi:hypothetical protein